MPVIRRLIQIAGQVKSEHKSWQFYRRAADQVLKSSGFCIQIIEGLFAMTHTVPGPNNDEFPKVVKPI